MGEIFENKQTAERLEEAIKRLTFLMHAVVRTTKVIRCGTHIEHLVMSRAQSNNLTNERSESTF